MKIGCVYNGNIFCNETIKGIEFKGVFQYNREVLICQ